MGWTQVFTGDGFTCGELREAGGWPKLEPFGTFVGRVERDCLNRQTMEGGVG